MAPRREPAPGELPDGTINVGTPDEMRPRLLLWKRQQAALEHGEDPTLLDDENDTSDLDDYDDL